MLSDGDIDPFRRFAELFDHAQATEPFDATACALATASADGQPAVRMVLLKSADARGFVFFTNYESRKSQDLGQNPQAALCFYWPTLGNQVRIEGHAVRVNPDESDAYFHTRARPSQLGAWASQQGRPLGQRSDLLERVHEAELRFAEGPVPRPAHWGGFLLVPHTIEFWAAEPSRLHDRIQYRRSQLDGPAGQREWTGWTSTRLYP